eukprot:g5294.t1
MHGLIFETYATVHQLVSTVAGQLDTNANSSTPGEFLKAAFPPGSMTGAPKIRSCELLEELEEVDRGVYGGCLGYVSVTTSASDLCVVIRTIVASEELDPEEDERAYTFTLNSGGAITVLSTAADEYDEMLLKLRAVREALEAEFPSLSKARRATSAEESTDRSLSPSSKGEPAGTDGIYSGDGRSTKTAPNGARTTSVFTTLRADFDDNGGVRIELLPLHFKRLQRSSRVLLGCSLPENVSSPQNLRDFIVSSVRASSSSTYRVRVDICEEKGERESSRQVVIASIAFSKLSDPVPLFVTLDAFVPTDSKRIALTRRLVLLDAQPSETDCVECYYKTANRAVYDDRLRHARAACDAPRKIDDVLLQNVRGEITETCIANVAIEVEPGKWVTPALRSGLLPGVCRAFLISKGVLTERPLSVEEFRRAVVEGDSRVVGFNALRGVFDIDMVL